MIHLSMIPYRIKNYFYYKFHKPTRLAGRSWFIRNRKENSILCIKYPENCPYSQEMLGDYCWGLALASEEGKAQEFYKENCPCDPL